MNRLYSLDPKPLALRVYVEGVTSLTVDVYNIAGDILVKNLVQGTFQKGWLELTWDGRNNLGDLVASDIYIVRMKTDRKVILKKIAVIQGSR